MSDAREGDADRKAVAGPAGERLDPGGGPVEEDPELAAIEYSVEDGLIYVEGVGWLEREDAETELGAEKVAELARTQPKEFLDYVARRRGEIGWDDE